MAGVDGYLNSADKYMDKAIELLMGYGPKLLLAILVLIVGWKVIGTLSRSLGKMMEAKDIEVSLRDFLCKLVSAGLKLLLLIVVAGMVGIATSSLVAVVGACGLAIGLALQGSLANFAGGVIILFFKPFSVGDVVEAQGYTGRIKEIQIFNTIMTTLDNQRVIVPNGILSNGCIKNIFVEDTRRVDWTFGIGYGDDIRQAKDVLDRLVKADSRILPDKGTEIYVSAHGDSAVNLLLRVWARSDDYWGVYFEMLENVKIAFDEENITIPYPQRDVHLIGGGAA
ncbi:MAG: mechanosensitive ion channel domain-containing protein [Thermodesulfobacteriota bacterium]